MRRRSVWKRCEKHDLYQGTDRDIRLSGIGESWMRKLRKLWLDGPYLVWMAAFIIIPLSIGVFLVNRFALSGDMPKVIEKTAGSVVGMIPAGMYLLTSLALAVGVIKLAKRKTKGQNNDKNI